MGSDALKLPATGRIRIQIEERFFDCAAARPEKRAAEECGRFAQNDRRCSWVVWSISGKVAAE